MRRRLLRRVLVQESGWISNRRRKIYKAVRDSVLGRAKRSLLLRVHLRVRIQQAGRDDAQQVQHFLKIRDVTLRTSQVLFEKGVCSSWHRSEHSEFSMLGYCERRWERDSM